MPRRQTKADRILNDAAMRLEAARIREHTAQSELNTARDTLAALQEAYDALEKELAPKPRKKATTAPASQKDLPVHKPALCGACGNTEDFQDHFKPSPNYHAFDAPGKKPRKGATTSSTVSSEAEREVATAVGAGD